MRGTHRATARIVVFQAHAPVVAKGKGEPVEVWEAVEALGRTGDLGGDPSTPLVGRDHERALLLGAFARVRVDRSPQLVTLVGVPGIGKSRLVAVLGDVVRNDEEIISWRYGRCLPYGDGVTFWALGEIVKAQCGHPRERPGRGRIGEARAGGRRPRPGGGAALGRDEPRPAGRAHAGGRRAA